MATPVLVALSYYFVDRPLATVVYRNLLPYRRYFDWLTHVVDPFAIVASCVLLAAVFMVATGRRIGPVLGKLVRVASALCVAVVAKDQLKYAFGRTWPETWVQNNLSYFRDGVFGFFPFHGGQGWYAFPSGHTVVVCVVAASLWLLFPRGRPVYALAVALVVVGLIGADYHWLGDIVAGGALGTAIGVGAAQIGQETR